VRKFAVFPLLLVGALLLTGCGGGGGGPEAGSTISVGGTITGLKGTGLVLQLNGGNNLAIAQSATTFVFAAQINPGGSFNVTVLNQPSSPSQVCSVSSSGPASTPSMVNVSVNCQDVVTPPNQTPTFTIGGSISGLTGAGLVLQNNGADNLPLVAGTSVFGFTTPLKAGDGYMVSVLNQPSDPAQICSVVNSTGTVAALNVTNVQIACQTVVTATPTYSVGGSISGLSGSGLVLQNNAGDNLIVPAGSSNFAFSTKLKSGDGYVVTVLSQPNNPTGVCSVANGTGTVVSSNVLSIRISCRDPLVYFYADNGVTGRELWKTDGTATGTGLVKDIMPGPATSEPFSGSGFVTLKNWVYFVAADSRGDELWKTDGTESGTQLVKDIRPGSSRSSPTGLTEYNGHLYFAAYGDGNGQSLWRTDGTEAGTTVISDVGSGTDTVFISGFINFKGLLYFTVIRNASGEQELWRTDGTTAGTVLVRNIKMGSSVVYIDSSSVNGSGSYIYFIGEQGTLPSNIWRTDGTADGTVKMADLNLLSLHSPRDIRVFKGEVYFVATNSFLGQEIWKLNPTVLGGAVMLKNINSVRLQGSDPSEFTEFQGELYFSAWDGFNGTELWKTDGTEAGTALVSNINTPSNSGSFPKSLTVFKGNLYFYAHDGINGEELWRTDGSSTGTVKVKEIYPSAGGATPRFLAATSNALYFSAGDGVHGTELWKTDGTDAGTVLVKDINPGSGGSAPARLFVN
jgi:ELWxxDGT repeat protein